MNEPIMKNILPLFSAETSGSPAIEGSVFLPLFLRFFSSFSLLAASSSSFSKDSSSSDSSPALSNWSHFFCVHDLSRDSETAQVK